MAAFEVLLLVFGIVLLLYCFYALTSGRLRIKRPRKWKENLKEFKREKLPFIYYFMILVCFLIGIILIMIALI
ncbi:MAG: hypothetical protein RAP70_03145 [Candidatus Celaenobacter antarcticus]|nr:hypothetical protein [Candidatus Celaenobacter antarcticus]